MITTKTSNQPVQAVLKIDMVIAGEQQHAGDVVELAPRDFRYLFTYDRVLPATRENVAAVKEAAAAARKALEARRAAANETIQLRAEVAALKEELEKLKKAK